MDHTTSENVSLNNFEKMTKEQFTIWFAGFYEGEGCPSNAKSESNNLRISTYQNDKAPFIYAQKIWGGSILTRTRKSPASDKLCTCSELRFNGKLALKFIEDIRPWMIVPYKIKQLEDAVWLSTQRGEFEYICEEHNKVYKNKSNLYRHNKQFHMVPYPENYKRKIDKK